MRLSLAAAVLALGWAAAASADDNDWGSLAVVSTTMGVHANRLCVGEGSRGDLGCPADAPTVSGHTISGTFIGDGSGLTGVTASAADRITSGTTLMIANGNTDFISITTGGVDTGYFWPTGILTINGVSISTAHGISSTNGYFGRKVGVGLANPAAPLHVSTTDMFLNAPIQTWSSGAGRTLDLGQPTGTDDAFRFRTQNAFQFMVDSFPALNIHHTGRIGVGTALPSVGLDISSTLRLANGGETCDADRAGAMRYTSASTFDFCDGINGWRSLQVIAASVGTDRLVSGTTSFLVISDTGYISLTQAGTNTAWFSPSTGLVTLGVSSTGGISGTTAYFADRVGIGTPGPAALLHLTSSSDVRMLFTNNASGHGPTDGLLIRQNNTSSYIYNQEAAGGLYFGTNGNSRLGINSAGYIGIRGGSGSTAFVVAPSNTLHIAGAIQLGEETSATLNTCDADRAGAIRYTSASTFDFCDGNNGWRSLAAMATAGGVTTDRLVSGTSNVTVNEGGDISFSTAGTVRASLDTGGSLTVAGVVNANRIRESTTGMYLDYWNTSSKLGIFGPNGDAKVAFTIVGGSAQYGQVLADDAHSNAYPQYSFMSDDDTGMIGVSGTLRLVTNGSERFRVNESGQAAIGTTQPSDTLHVAGGNVMVSHASTGQYKWQYDPAQAIWSVGGGDYFTVKRGSTRLLNVDSSGRMGLSIGGLAASTTLHVNGTLRMADGGEACDTDRAGAVRYTSASTFDFCDGTNGWRSLAAMATAGGVTTDRLVSGSSVATLSPNGVLTVGGRLNIVTGTNVVAVGQSAAANANASNLTAVGVDAGKSFLGTKGLAVGYQAAENNSATDVTAVGYRAGRYNSSTTLTAVGAEAAMNSSGTAVTAVGGGAGANNTGHATTLVGGSAGRNNTANYIVATGYGAATDNTGYAAVLSGLYAGTANTGGNIVALGAWAGSTNTGDDLTAVGYQAARYNTGTGVTVLGYQAGISNTYTNVTLLGNKVYTAGKNNQVILGNSSVVEVATSGTLLSAGVSASGAVTATYFSGDGSRLTGLPGGDRIVSGTTSVIAAQDRSVTISTMGAERLLVGENGRIAVGGVPNPSVTLHLKTNGSFTEGSIAARRLFVGAGGLLGDFSTLSDTVGNAVIFMNGGAASFYGPGSSPAYDTRVFSAGARNLTVEYQSSGATKSFNVVNNGTGILRSRFDGVMLIGGTSTSLPGATLHVSGTIRMADGGEACDADRAGAMRYTSASTFDFCDGTNGWRSLAAMASAGGVTTDRIVSGTTSVIAAQDRSVTIATAGSVRMVVGENGRIGVNSTAPIRELEVKPLVSGTDVGVRIANDGTANGRAFLELFRNNSDAGLLIMAPGGGANDGLRMGTTHSSGNLMFHTGANTTLGNNERMRIDYQGRVGIGTAQPLAPLHVSSTTLAANAPVQSWSSGSGRNIHLEQPGSTDDPWRLRTSNAIQLMVDSYPGLTVGAAGNVGISTTNPSKTLTVNGDADISGTVKVAGTGDEACGPALRGTIRQNPVTRKLEVCRY